MVHHPQFSSLPPGHQFSSSSKLFGHHRQIVEAMPRCDRKPSRSRPGQPKPGPLGEQSNQTCDDPVTVVCLRATGMLKLWKLKPSLWCVSHVRFHPYGPCRVVGCFGPNVDSAILALGTAGHKLSNMLSQKRFERVEHRCLTMLPPLERSQSQVLDPLSRLDQSRHVTCRHHNKARRYKSSASDWLPS